MTPKLTLINNVSLFLYFLVASVLTQIVLEKKTKSGLKNTKKELL